MSEMGDEVNPAALAVLEHLDTEITRVDVSAIAALNRGDVEMQIDAAHRHPRSIGKFLKEATALATLTPDIASACIYTLPRGGKQITGPSVRLAEIAASAYGNLHVGARVLDAADRTVTAQGVAWDLEKNLRVTIESQRRITGKTGKRYDDDMITVTGNAAASIALRNAIFRVVPRAYVDQILAAARRVAVGDARTLVQRRSNAIEHFNRLGVTTPQILSRLEKATIEDVGLDDLEILIGLKTAIKDHGASIDECFPATVATVAAVASLEDKLKAARAAKTAPAKAAVVPASDPSLDVGDDPGGLVGREPGQEG